MDMAAGSGAGVDGSDDAGANDNGGNYVLSGEELGTDLSSYLAFAPSEYETQLQAKVGVLRQIFQPYYSAEPAIFRSPPEHYRLRAKLGIGMLPVGPPQEDGEQQQQQQHQQQQQQQYQQQRLSYLMWDERNRPVPMVNFPIASKRINDLMPRLLLALEAGPPLLRSGLRAVNFLDTLVGGKGNMLVSLMYKCPIDSEAWATAAGVHLRDALDVQIVGRSKGVVVAVDRAYVEEAFDLNPPPAMETDEGDSAVVDGRMRFPILRYKQLEGAFTNPNGHMAVLTLRWLCARADAILAATAGPAVDLLELYCGGGNHTVALSQKAFRHVVGVEINHRLVAVARENLALNGIKNANIIQIPSEKFRPNLIRRYLQQERGGGGQEQEQQEQEQEDEEEEEGDYNFGAVLVDPPRAGLDRYTRSLVSQYEHIFYISCGPTSLVRDLRGESEEEQKLNKKHRSIASFGLAQTHEIVDMCVLDHFPYTTHIETAVHLQRRRRT